MGRPVNARSSTAGMLAAALLVLGGCTAAGPSSTATSALSPAGNERAPASTSPLGSLQRAALTCADEAGPSTPPGGADLRVAGLALEGLRRAADRAMPSLPLIVSGRLQFRFLKVFLYVTPQASPTTTLSVTAPAGAWLYYTDAATWASQPDAPRMLAGASKRVTVGTCPDRIAGYPGGLLLPAAGCVTLHVQGSKEATGHSVTVPVGVRRC